MRKIWDIPGGIHPPENKIQSTQSAIATIPLPEEFILPLNLHIGAPAEAICAIGDKVLKGEKIADGQGYVSANIHAPTSGLISAIEDRFIPHSSGMKAPCIVIKPDGEERWCELSVCEDYSALSKENILDKVVSAGVVGLGGAGFPTAVKLQPKQENSIHTLILNGTECEPYITADHMLMLEHAEDIILGACLMSYLLDNPQHILIGIEDNKPDSIQAMSKALDALRERATENKKHYSKQSQSALDTIEIVVFPTKYPSGGEKQLIQILTGEEVPQGKIPADMGIVVQNLATAATSYRAVRFGEPLIKRITTVVGESLKTQQNIEVLIGTPVSHVLSQHGYKAENNSRLILGGPMMGFAMDHADIPVAKTTNCILAPSKKELPNPDPAQACIRCGLCAEACPASLLPQQLFWYAQSEDFDKLNEHNLFDCIECGACSYVCPSHIPLVQYYRASKSTIRRLDEEKLQSDHARERFEFRKARIEKAEAEKEAKRQARKQAAEKAKQEAKKKADQLAKDSSNNEVIKEKDKLQNVGIDNSNTEAKKREPSQEQSPEQERPKLERALSRAENRFDRAQQQLQAGRNIDEASRETKKIATLEARLKEAELKVNQAKENLEAFEARIKNNTTGGISLSKNTSTSNENNDIEDKEKTIATLLKRLTTAQEKLKEAEKSQSPTIDALSLGVSKLQEKYDIALSELKELRSLLENKVNAGSTSMENTDKGDTVTENKEVSIADDAISRAQAKAAAQAKMSDAEKIQHQYESLKVRLSKAKERLAKAEAENNEHVSAFRDGAAKLHQKLRDFQAEHKIKP